MNQQDKDNLTPTNFVDDILSACDSSNWDDERNQGDYFRGLKDAYKIIHEIANEYQIAMYKWNRATTKPAPDAMREAVDLGPHNAAFHAALHKYPDAFEALHYFWNEAFANGGRLSAPVPPADGAGEAIAKWLWEYLYSSKGFGFWSDISEECREMWRSVAAAFIVFLSLHVQHSMDERKAKFYSILVNHIPQDILDSIWQDVKEAGVFDD